MPRPKKDTLDLDPQYPLDDLAEELFCQNYVTNGGVAYYALQSCGLDESLGSAEACRNKAQLWKKRPRIKKRILYLKAEYSKVSEKKRAKLLGLLEDILDSEITDFVNQDPDTKEITIKPFEDFPEFRKKAITQVSCTKTKTVRGGGQNTTETTEITSSLKLENKLRAAKLYGDLTGLSTDYSKCRSYLQGLGYDLVLDKSTGELLLQKDDHS